MGNEILWAFKTYGRFSRQPLTNDWTVHGA